MKLLGKMKNASIHTAFSMEAVYMSSYHTHK